MTSGAIEMSDMGAMRICCPVADAALIADLLMCSGKR